MTAFLSGLHEATVHLDLAPLLEQVAAGAAARDFAHTLPHAEFDTLKALRLGALRVPAALGGHGLGFPVLFQVVRDIATADSNIAHALRNHFGLLERFLRTPDAAESQRVFALAAEGKLLGGAFSEAGEGPAGTTGARGTVLVAVSDGSWRLRGAKHYSTGNLYADYLLVGAFDPQQQVPRQVLLPKSRAGISTPDDWVGFGQRLTGSGTTTFDDVHVQADEVLPGGAPLPGTEGYYEFTFQQIYLTTVISGIARRIVADGLELVRTRSRNYYHALAERVADEPAIHGVVGRIAAQSRAIDAVVDRAVAALEVARGLRGKPGGPEASLAASIAAAEAKVFTDEAASSVASQLIDLASGSSVSVERGLDRHWRNIKVLASHNPRIYKEQVLGRFYLHGEKPPTGPYF